MGRALTPVPYLSTAVLAASAVRDERLLAGIADGSLIAAVALGGDLTADEDRLAGTALYVLDGHLADVIICVAGGVLYAARGTDVPAPPAGDRR